jgi:AcrR family transcriptional regulator
MADEITDDGASQAEGEGNVAPMEEEPRRLRADAERNRRRLLDAATEVFSERGLEVGVGEIAQRAGVGRGTLFRNFPSKEDLIAAIVVERFRESIARGAALLEAEDPGEALFTLLDQALTRSETDRALFEALDDAWLCRKDIGAVHTEMLTMLDALVRRAQKAGAVRADIGAIDILVLVKGMCEATRSLRHLDGDFELRQLDLVRAAICAPGHERPLRGRPPTLDEFELHRPPADRPPADRPAAVSG